MKKLATLLSLVMCVSLFAGCSAETETTETTTTAPATTETTTEEAEDIAWPEKTVTIVVPAAAGGDTDSYGRLFAAYLEEELGQTFVVSNVAGGGCSIGAQQVLDSEPDGYTIGIGPAGNEILNTMSGLVEFTYADFANACIPVTDTSNMIVAPASKFEGVSFADVMADLAENPRSYSFGTEVGTLGLLAPAALQSVSGCEFNMVDVGGLAARVTAILGEQVDFTLAPYASAAPYLESGDMVAMAMFSETRHPALPDVPTLLELGFEGVDFDKAFIMQFAPGTPTEIVDKFNEAVKNICANPEFIEDMSQFAIVPEFYDAEQTVAWMDKATAQYMTYEAEFIG